MGMNRTKESMGEIGGGIIFILIGIACIIFGLVAREYDAEQEIFIGTGIVVTIPSVIFLVYECIMQHRYTIIVKNGIEGQGVVKKINHYYRRCGDVHFLVVKFKDGDGKEHICETKIAVNDLDKIVVGSNVTLIIYGEYAIFKDCEKLNII